MADAVGPAAGGAGPTLLVVATIAPTIRNFLLPYAEHLRARGWRVEAAASGVLADDAVRSAFDAVYEVPFSRSIRDVASTIRSSRSLDRVIRQSRPDVIHVHTPIASFVARAVAHRVPEPERPVVVYTAHGFHFHAGAGRLTNAVFRTLEQVAGRWTDYLVVMNDEDASAALAHRIVPRRRLVRMRGIGVDTAWYSRSAVSADDTSELRTRLGLNGSEPVFVVLAELAPRKRVGDVIAAFAQLRRRDARLVLAGAGPDREALALLADRLGVSDRVAFLGVIKDVRPLLAISTALVLASIREGLPRSVMEGLCLELPAIVSSARGSTELVGSDAGIVFPIGDVPALASAMDEILANPEAAKAMGVRGRARMVDRYDIHHLLAEHDVLYAGALMRARRSASDT